MTPPIPDLTVKHVRCLTAIDGTVMVSVDFNEGWSTPWFEWDGVFLRNLPDDVKWDPPLVAEEVS